MRLKTLLSDSGHTHHIRTAYTCASTDDEECIITHLRIAVFHWCASCMSMWMVINLFEYYFILYLYTYNSHIYRYTLSNKTMCGWVAYFSQSEKCVCVCCVCVVWQKWNAVDLFGMSNKIIIHICNLIEKPMRIVVMAMWTCEHGRPTTSYSYT